MVSVRSATATITPSLATRTLASALSVCTTQLDPTVVNASLASMVTLGMASKTTASHVPVP